MVVDMGSGSAFSNLLHIQQPFLCFQPLQQHIRYYYFFLLLVIFFFFVIFLYRSTDVQVVLSWINHFINVHESSRNLFKSLVQAVSYLPLCC